MKENFISDSLDELSGAKVNLIDNNKTLYIDQFTSEPDEEHEFTQDVHTIEDAFRIFQPKVKVEFDDEDGGDVPETLSFSEIRDFEAREGKGQLVKNSPYLSGVKSKIDVHADMRKNIEKNRKLRDLLKDAASREDLKVVLTTLLAELESSTNQ